ncbi:hypothetical protein DFP72DRAFT_849449 [Ephemerocybe angulata]|uniref:Nephrocystin 3-like N-terminal domain-containing protein n=1 Tax=Ephemerocybe angulata TaxID=980116 RepID=A0A8H6HUX5_9AGAR|nr:hypothetical protein DFP72DRAFT_849449 [Tulosesus angulatus]
MDSEVQGLPGLRSSKWESSGDEPHPQPSPRNAQAPQDSVAASMPALMLPPDDLAPSIPRRPQPLDNMQARVVAGGGSGPSVFSNASNFHMEHFQYNHYDRPPRQGSSGWDQLLKAASPSALHNSLARFDPPKCDEDTRVELINEIMTWIEDRESPTQLLCMTGAAGSGKSALQQTVAEKCAEKGILAASFFFNVSDPTRNDISRIIPTITYQLGQTSQTLRRVIGAVAEDDALVFSQTLKVQIEKLIIGPLAKLPPSEASGLPYAILIDGLDECYGEPQQRALLRAIQVCFLDRRSQFRIFIASRPELAIFEALEPGGHLHGINYPIRLSDDYDATSDIRLSLHRSFGDIGRKKRWRHAWFTEEEVEAIVEAASGQYIYAATVIRYVSEPRRSPAERLRTVLACQSGVDKVAKPFASLDSMYTLILTKAREAYEAIDNTHDFLFMLRVYLVTMAIGLNLDISHQDQLFGLEDDAHETILCDLRSILAVQEVLEGILEVRVYHKSFQDFLCTPERAGSLHIPTPRINEHITRCCLRTIDSFSLEDIAGGITLSNRDFILRWEALNLNLFCSAALLFACSASMTEGTETGAIADSFVQFGTSGFEKSRSEGCRQSSI